MPVSLKKGGNIQLSKNKGTIFEIGLGWDVNDSSTGQAYDLDVTCFGLEHINGKPVLLGDADNPYMIFYNKLQSDDGAIKHSGDDRTGDASGDGPDEVITVDVSKLDGKVAELSFIVTIDGAQEKGQNFGQVSRCFIEVKNQASGEVECRYDLGEDFSTETAVQFGSLYKREGNWKFKAVGAGQNAGLADYLRGYGYKGEIN